MIGVLQANLDERERWQEFGNQLAAISSGWDAARTMHLAGAAAVGLLCFLLGRIVPRRLRKRQAQVEGKAVSEGLAQTVIASAES